MVRFHKSAWLAALAIVSNAAPTLAAEPLQLAPSSPWKADFADDSCALIKTFTHDDSEVYLELRNYGSDGVGVTVAGHGLALRPNTPRTRFLPDADWQEQPFSGAVNGSDGWKGASWGDTLLPNSEERATYAAGETLEEPSAARLAEIRGYEIDRLFDRDVELLTGSLQKPDEVMQSCLDGLFKSWGLDFKTQQTLLRRIKPTYKEAWWKQVSSIQREIRDQQGITFSMLHLRLLVDETGKTTGCKVSEAAQTGEALADKLCRTFLEKATFAPALDSASQPVKSFWTTTLTAVLRTESR